MKHELDLAKQSQSHAELMSQQLQSMSETREKDLKSVIKARDDAIGDAKTLAERVEGLEDALKSQVSD